MDSCCRYIAMDNTAFAEDCCLAEHTLAECILTAGTRRAFNRGLIVCIDQRAFHPR